MFIRKIGFTIYQNSLLSAELYELKYSNFARLFRLTTELRCFLKLLISIGFLVLLALFLSLEFFAFHNSLM